jgi:hypothetical protein
MRVYAAGVFQRIAVFPHEFQALSTRTRKKARAPDFLDYAVLWAFLLGHFSIRLIAPAWWSGARRLGLVENVSLQVAFNGGL